jgi:hypothetical protein
LLQAGCQIGIILCADPFDLTSPDEAFAAILDTLARQQGKRDGARILPIPWPLMRLVAAFTDLLGVGPITGEELGMLRRGNTADIAPFVAAFGCVPLAFAEGIRVRGA